MAEPRFCQFNQFVAVAISSGHLVGQTRDRTAPRCSVFTHNTTIKLSFLSKEILFYSISSKFDWTRLIIILIFATFDIISSIYILLSRSKVGFFFNNLSHSMVKSKHTYHFPKYRDKMIVIEKMMYVWKFIYDSYYPLAFNRAFSYNAFSNIFSKCKIWCQNQRLVFKVFDSEKSLVQGLVKC